MYAQKLSKILIAMLIITGLIACGNTQEQPGTVIENTLEVRESALWQEQLDLALAEAQKMDPAAKLIGILLPSYGDKLSTFTFITQDKRWDIAVDADLVIDISRIENITYEDYPNYIMDRSRMKIAPWDAYSYVEPHVQADCTDELLINISNPSSFADTWSVSEAWSIWFTKCDIRYRVDMETGAITSQ